MNTIVGGFFAQKHARKGGASYNTAQRLLQAWCQVRPELKPKRPRVVREIVATDAEHVTREGKTVMQADGFTPVPLKHARLVDRSRRYPYASARQNTRRSRAAFAV